jgi:autotransporter-associated beta strand protein
VTTVDRGTLVFETSANLGNEAATNTIRLANGATLSNTAAAAVDLTANRSVEIAGTAATVNVSNAAGILTISGVISGPDCPVLNKTGTGTLIFTGVNTYDGMTNIAAGTLILGTGIGGGTTGNLGDGNVTNSGTLVFNRSNAYTVPNIISGTGALRQEGTGTTTLTGTNTYTGVTTISLGTLSVGTIGNGGGPGNMGNATAATGNLVLNGGTLQYTGAGETTNRGFTLGTAGGAIDGSGTGGLVLGSGGIAYSAGTAPRNLTLTGTGTGNILSAALANAAGGTTTLTKSGTGTWSLEGTTANTYTGVTTVTGGTLVLNKTGVEAIPGDGVTAKIPRDIVVNGGTLRLDQSDQIGDTVSMRVVTGTVNFNGFNETLYEVKNVGGTVNYNTGTIVVTDPTWYAGGTNTVSGSTTFNTDLNVRGGTNTITGTGTGGAGTLTVGNPTATLNFIQNDAFNDGEDDIAASPTDINITINSDNATSGRLALTGNVTFAADTGAGAPATFNSFASITSAGAGSNPGRLDLNGADRTFTIANSTQTNDMVVSASIVDVAGGGTSGLTKEGAGTLELSGSNTYAGDTNVNNGTLKVTNGAAINDGGSVVVANTAGAIFEVNGNETIGDVSGGGATGGEIALNTGNTLTIAGGAGSTTFNGLVSGAGNLAVSAIGSLTLDSAVTGGNTFTGDVTVGGTTATLFAQNADALGAVDDITVNTGGTLFLTGTGDRINDTADLILGGGVLNTNGLSETLGTLTLTADSIIDFGAGASILSFADSSANSWGAFTLSLWNWSGNEIIGGGTDQIRFASNGLTAGQLGQIRFFTDAGVTEVSFDANTPINGFVGTLGEVVPVPEPGSVMVGLAMFGLAGWRERRKNAARRREERAASRS